MDERARRLSLFFAVNYFAQGMAGIAYTPLSYLLKDDLGLGAAESAVFISVMTLPLMLKPFFGLLTDLLPWRGRRRAPHLAAVSLLNSACWLLMAWAGGTSYALALALALVVNVSFVLADVVCDGVMVERGKESGRTAFFQSVQQGTLYLTLVVTGLGGGLLAKSPTLAFLLCAAFPLMTAWSSRWLDESGTLELRETAAQGWAGLRAAAREPRVWAAAAGIFLWSFWPFLGTAQFYYQSETLKLSPVFIGGLSTASGVAGLLAAGVFGRLTRAPGVSERLLRWSIAGSAALGCLYAAYEHAYAVLAITLVSSFFGVLFRLAWLDLAARSCPQGAEATVFAAFMAVFNLSAMASNWLGGELWSLLVPSRGPYLAMIDLTVLSIAATLACWPLLRLTRAPARP